MQIVKEINSELILAYHKFTLVLFVEIGVLFAQIDCLNLGCACSGKTFRGLHVLLSVILSVFSFNVHSPLWGVKKWQNSVHVVVVDPL